MEACYEARAVTRGCGLARAHLSVLPLVLLPSQPCLACLFLRAQELLRPPRSSLVGDRVTRLLSLLRKWLEILGLLLDPTFYPHGGVPR